uniref:Putative secreted protein n=1 Tax=Ixodes ricinus TaxID=34613 RepID=A0A6B0UA83_IXORI
MLLLASPLLQLLVKARVVALAGEACGGLSVSTGHPQSRCVPLKEQQSHFPLATGARPMQGGALAGVPAERVNLCVKGEGGVLLTPE